MRLYLRLAWRNIWRHRRRTLIVVLAIGLTLAMMMLYDGLIAGFEEAIYGNAIKVLGGNIQIHADGYHDKANQTPLLPLPDELKVVDAALAQPQVVAASRRINTGGLASNRKGAFAVSIVGIEPEKELPVSLVSPRMSSQALPDRRRPGCDLDRQRAGRCDGSEGRRPHHPGRERHPRADAPAHHDRRRYLRYGHARYREAHSLHFPGRSAGPVWAERRSHRSGADIETHRTGRTVIKALKPSLPGYEIDSWQTSFPELERLSVARARC